jgi:hypothetical protein
VFVVGCRAGQLADLMERASVYCCIQAFPDGELAELVLPGHLVGAAHGFGERFAPPQLCNFRFPGHGAFLVRAVFADRS